MEHSMKKTAAKIIGGIIVAKVIQEWVCYIMALTGLAMEKDNLDPDCEYEWTKGDHRIPRNKQELHDKVGLIEKTAKLASHGIKCYLHPDKIGKE